MMDLLGFAAEVGSIDRLVDLQPTLLHERSGSPLMGDSGPLRQAATVYDPAGRPSSKSAWPPAGALFART
ncbi:hypothetical protein EV292_102628 [Sphingomonas sp. BK235]|nr:hypothetical protein EV292_102628 [Sphingomonas sp. BK235]